MDFLMRIVQTFLDKWAIPIVVGVSIVFITERGNRGKNNKKRIALFLLVVIITTLLLTITDNSSESKKAISITDQSFVVGVVGLASLYDNNLMPIWFEDNLDDPWLAAEIDNTGTSYANITHVKLIIDDFKPVSVDDILLFRGESHAGTPSVAEADVDLSSIEEGSSEYDINFTKYQANKYGVAEGEGIPLKKGETFYIEQSSRARLVTFLQLNKSGIYTYHFEVGYEYYKKKDTMETKPFSFIYIAGNIKDYEFNKVKLDAFHYEERCEYENKELFYDIDGRTLRIHDCPTVFRQNSYGDFFTLIKTIVVEDGVLNIDSGSFGDEPGLCMVTTIYLPKSLEVFKTSSIINDGELKTIYFGGTESQWDALIQKKEDERLFNLEGVEIIFNYGEMPSQESLLMEQQNDDNYYRLFPNTD